MPHFVQGICEDYCPEHEAKLRTKEKLLHFYELKNGQKNTPGLLVKAFSRSAAGVKAPRAKDLRTERCLQRTVEYLLKDIILDKRKPFHVVYDFIFDRLRAVRQEIVMQNYKAQQTVKLLEPMIMFLSYSRYVLCEEAIDNFDTKICEQHLQECIKRALCCYDEIDPNAMKLNELRNRNFIEALYQLFNLGSTEALNRAVTLPTEICNEAPFNTTFVIAMSYYQGNLYRVVDGFKKLPHILSAIASLKLQSVRRKLYMICAHAYSSKQLAVPVNFLCQLTIHEHTKDLISDCKYYNIRTSDDHKCVHFFKSDFKADAPVLRTKREHFVEKKLKSIYLPEVLLLKMLK